MPSQVYTNHGDDEYRVVSREGNGALIFARPDYSAGEHEHPEAQVSILFKGASASLLTHSETGKTMRTGLAPESFSYIPPRPAPSVELAERRRIVESVRLRPEPQ